ncbi:unnamed protein product [Adineta ricciae]|uniref:Uncharacterized protein n=1 Tax=Adineta ricciae TaxID=249248 RepID=A0A814PQY7_ADIRI|nr:unnamed protein product [Adineta ricciae]
MSDDDEQQQRQHFTNSHDGEHRRRLLEIKNELQTLMRQKKKYDEEKLKQDADFLQSEIIELRKSIADINDEINHQIKIGKKLRVQMTNLRSRSGVRYTNRAVALRDKRRYEAELKKENKTEEYRELARREIRAIDAALPILKEEDEYKVRLTEAEDAQQAATTRRKKLEENFNKNLRRQTEIKQLLSENAEKLPEIEATIESLRSERERLLSANSEASTNRRKTRRRLSTLQQRNVDSPSTDPHTPIQTSISLEEACLEHEKQQNEDQLNKVNTLINYFREKLNEHGLASEVICTTPCSELTSPLYPPITPMEEQSILSSYMEERGCDNAVLLKTVTHEPPTAIAMKLPRNFATLNFNSPTTNEIIHSPYYDGNEIEYKKELSSDIMNKYGGQPKKNKQQSSITGKKHKKNKKNFAITHNPQMIALYNNIRSSSGSSDTLPSMPMYEYELYSALQALEFFKQSLESYSSELSRYYIKPTIEDEQQNKFESGGDDDIPDSALDTYSDNSSLLESIQDTVLPQPQKGNRLEGRLSISSDDKKTLISSSSNKDEYEESNNHCETTHKPNGQIDRQISDEGYRSVRHEQQPQVIKTTSNPNSPLLTRSESFNCAEKVGQWLSNTISTSSVPMALNYYIDFQSTDNENDGRSRSETTTISVPQ